MTKRLVSATIFMALVVAAPAAAQTEDLPDPGMLPSNGLFSFLERAVEAVGTFFTFGDESKAVRFLDLAEERLAEASALLERDQIDRAEIAIARYEEQLGAALDRIAEVDGATEDDLSAKVAEATLTHLDVLAGVYEQVPQQAQGAIERAMEASSTGIERAAEALSGEPRQRIDQRVQDLEGLDRARQLGLPVPSLESVPGPGQLPDPARQGAGSIPAAPGEAAGRSDVTGGPPSEGVPGPPDNVPGPAANSPGPPGGVPGPAGNPGP